MESMLEVFGKENLKCWNEKSLANVNISPSSKHFLETSGLPMGVDWTMMFDAHTDRPLPYATKNGLRVIGRDGDARICLDENHDGRVVALEDGKDIRFINSSVECFGSFLALYQRYREAVRGMDDDEAMELIDQTEQQMRSIDKSAFDGREYWWPVIIEQMRDGML